MERLKTTNKAKNSVLEEQIVNLKEELDKANSDYGIELQIAKDQRKIDSEQIKLLESEIAELKMSNEEDQNKRNTEIELKVKGKYKPEVHVAMAELQNLGIRDHAVGPAIRIICNMLGLNPNAVPSERTVAFNSFFAQAMNFQQLREILQYAALSKIPTTLCTDESIRNSEILHNFIIGVVDESTNEAREYVLGTLKGLDKSTNTILELLQKLVKKLDSDEDSGYWETFMMSLGSLMTDQASTNAKLAKELPKLKELIAQNDENWDELTEEQKKELTKIRVFYCQLHILHNMTPVVVKSLLEHEKYYRNKDDLKQPLIFVLLQELARFLGSRASSKYDVARNWKLFCERYNIYFSTVPDFKGHRFTILFVIAGAVFFLLNDIIKFYDEFKTQMHDDTKIDIGAALKDPLILSQLHLLAAINAYITGPLTRLTENSPTINSLSEHATSLIEFLDHVIEEPEQFLIGYAPFEHFEEAEEVTARSKAHLEHLDDVRPLYPDIISDAIEYVSEDLLDYCKKKFAPFLQGGAYYESTDDLRSVPRSNRRCESVFGFLGSDYSVAPQKRIIRRDIKVQSKINKTFEWFKAKPEEERQKIVLEAMASASQLQTDASEDEKALKKALWKKLLEKRKNDKLAAAIKIRNIQKALNKLQLNGGLWIDSVEMEEILAPLNATKKRKAVEDQIRYHKLTLQNVAQISPLYKFSANKVLKNLQTLKDNLTALMTNAAANAEENFDEESDE